jgi:hypothetical protein
LRSNKRERKHHHRLRAILDLRTPVCAAHDQAGGLVNDLHRGVRGVYALAAFAGGAADIDFDLVRLDFHVHFLCFRQHGDGGGAGVDAALRFGRGHALDPMHAALVFEAFVNILTVDLENDFRKPPRSDELESIVSTCQPIVSA